MVVFGCMLVSQGYVQKDIGGPAGGSHEFKKDVETSIMDGEAHGKENRQ